MSLRAITIDHRSDSAWHHAFIRYVPRIFPRASFKGWYELAGWDEGYCAIALADGDEIVANASVQRMSVILDGRKLTGWQFGAVGVIPSWRGKGLQREIMPRALALAAPADFVFLFANDNVLDFYPRYGFRRVIEHVHVADISIAPSPHRARKLLLSSAADRDLILRVASDARPVTTLFGAKDYGRVLLWYWTNYYQDGFYYDERFDALAVVEQEPGMIRVCDVLSARAVHLPEVLAALIAEPIHRVEFGFTPELLWPDARPAHPYTDSPLFVRGEFTLPATPFKYPVLAQT
jgi:GNAT superfamily N-acetyltransferase